MPDPAGLNTARLFLAVWPDDTTVCQRLDEAGRHLHGCLGGKASRPETLHLTLVFIGALARERIPGLRQALATIHARNFMLVLDHVDCWRHNRIAYLAPSAPPRALLDLVGQLEDLLDRQDILFDRRPYAPHITLIRKADCAKAGAGMGNPAQGRVSGSPGKGEIWPINWSAGSFVLVESVPTPSGVRYDVLERYALL